MSFLYDYLSGKTPKPPEAAAKEAHDERQEREGNAFVQEQLAAGGGGDEDPASSDGGWGEWTPRVLSGFLDGLWGAEEADPATLTAPEAAVESEDPAADPGVNMPQVDVIAEMKELGYDDEGQQQTTYGGFKGKGDAYANGEGGYWVAAGTEDAIKCDKVIVGGEEQWHWIGKSGKDYTAARLAAGKSSYVAREFRAYDDAQYHCVGAVSTVLEAAGLYEKDRGALEGEAEVTHGKSGEKVALNAGGTKKASSLKDIVNVNTFGSSGEVEGAVKGERELLAEGQRLAREEADEKANAREFAVGDEAYKDFVLRRSYEHLMSSAERDERLAGAGMALDKSDMGEQVNPADVKPGDLSQHWSGKSDGHATIVQVVQSKGVAKVDDSGKVDSTGTWKDGEFTMDETADPAMVGRHIVKKVARLGAHSAGGNDYNQDGAEAHAGIFTGKAADIGSKALEYYGRPNNSRWRGWSATFSSVEEAVAVDTPPIVDVGGGGEDDDSWYAWGERAGETVRGATDAARGVAQVGIDLARHGASRLRGAAPAEDSGASAPATVPEPEEAAPDAVEELDVKGCDYRIHADGTVHYIMGGASMRHFCPGTALYDAVRSEIEGKRTAEGKSPWPF